MPGGSPSPAGAPERTSQQWLRSDARDEGGPEITGQLLLTPVTDCDMTRPSYAENADGYILTTALMALVLGPLRRPGRAHRSAGVAAACEQPRGSATSDDRHVRIRPAARRRRGVRAGAGRCGCRRAPPSGPRTDPHVDPGGRCAALRCRHPWSRWPRRCADSSAPVSRREPSPGEERWVSGGVKPLDGVRVIEVDSWMAAPSAGAILADLGADVVKVEPLGGDAMRGTGRPAKVDGALQGYDFVFDVDNRGKRSIAVDLASDAGSSVVQRLCDTADIFLCNLLPHRQERFGLDPASLHARQPETRARNAHRVRHARARGVAARLRRHRLLRAVGAVRLDARDERRSRTSGPAGAGRPHDRPGARGEHPRGAAPRRPDRRGPGRRDLAVRDGGVDAGERLRRHGGRRCSRSPAIALPTDHAAHESVPVRRRPLGGVQHARSAGVRAVLSRRSGSTTSSTTNASTACAPGSRTWSNWSS